MKIDKPSKPLPASLTGEGMALAPTKGKPSQPPATTQSRDTSVSIGSTTAQLQSMESSMASTPAINATKVAEIKQAIADGRFKVNSEAVADRLLETVRDLIGGKG